MMHAKPSKKRTASPGRPLGSANRDVRELLLDSATALFAEHGVAGTTFAMIAKNAGSTPAMLHYYFKDRDQLCDAVVKERVSRIIAGVWEPIDPTEDATQILSGVVARMLDRVAKDAWIPSLWIREILNEGGVLRKRVLKSAPFGLLRPLYVAVERGQTEGQINPSVDPMLVIASTVGMVMLNTAAAKFLPQVLGKPIEPESVKRHVTSLLLDGIRIQSSRRPTSRKKNRSQE